MELFALFFMARQRSSQRLLAAAVSAQAGLNNGEQLQSLWKQFVEEMMPFQKAVQKEKDAQILEQIASLSKTAFSIQPLPTRESIQAEQSRPFATKRPNPQSRTRSPRRTKDSPP